jgi:mono/diheme cytochrome c family protein
VKRALVIAALAVACSREEPTQEVTRPQVAPIVRAPSARQLALADKLECNRCHHVPSVPAAAVRDKNCFACHQQIHQGAFDAEPDVLAKWQGRIQSMRYAPSLVVADRLQRAWVKQFLLHPHDVRPGSIAQMPRLAITDAEADELARWLVPVEDRGVVASDPSLVAHGEKLYRDFACARCHRFTGSRVDEAAMHASGRAGNEAWVLAPDLRFARERVQPGQLASWIENPRGAMEKLAGIGPDEARALAAFVATTPLAPLAKVEVPKRLPILEREVPWAEVSAKVFHDTCWHCHAVPDLARGDGGPGNSGGFGFPGRGLDLSSYTGISQGSVRDGERESIFAKLPDGTPRVIAHLMARHVEAAGGVVDGVRGMPLGLPALTLEQIQLVETWIAQGRPQ